MIYDIGLGSSVFIGNYTGDSLALHTWATKILAGQTENEAFFRAPLYPYVVALLYKIFGVSPWPVIIFQNLLGLLTGIVGFFCARRLFGPTVAFWAGLVIVLYPTLIYFEGETMITALAVFLYTLAVYRLVIAIREPGVRNVFVAGIVFGLAAIARPTILPLVVIFPVAFLATFGMGSYKQAVGKSLVLAVGLFLPVLPVTLTNLIKGGELVLISTQAGANFYIGNSAESDGTTVVALGPLRRVGPYRDNIWTSSVDEAERHLGRTLTQSEVSSYWLREAFRDIQSDLGRAAGLFVKKFYLFWHGQEIYNIQPLYFAGEYSGLMKVLLWRKMIDFPSGLLFPLMAMGMVLAVVRRRRVLVPILFALLFAVAVATFFVCARFRQPIVPLAIVFAVFGVDALLRLLRENARTFAVGCLGLLLLTAALNWGGNVDSETNWSQFHAGIGTAYVNKRNFSTGIIHLEKSLEIVPSNLGAYETLGQAYLTLGKLAQAESTYKRALARFPDHASFSFHLGLIHQTRQDFESARQQYDAALRHSPDYVPALVQLVSIFEHKNQPESALYVLQKLAVLQPDEVRVKQKIQELRESMEGGRK